jgi:hypothetical protein
MMESENKFVQSGEEAISLLERNSFFDDVARHFQGRYLRISTEGTLPGEVDDCRLHNVEVLTDEIVFTMMCDNDSATRYTVANPEQLIATRNSDGELEGLKIVSLDGSVTRVWFVQQQRSQDEDAAA